MSKITALLDAGHNSTLRYRSSANKLGFITGFDCYELRDVATVCEQLRHDDISPLFGLDPFVQLLDRHLLRDVEFVSYTDAEAEFLRVIHTPILVATFTSMYSIWTKSESQHD